MKQLEDVLKILKNKKCQHPHGYVNELFKYEAAGTDLKKSILHMMNKTKDTWEVPDMMKTVNVVMIPKPKKNKFAQHTESKRHIPVKCVSKYFNENAPQGWVCQDC